MADPVPTAGALFSLLAHARHVALLAAIAGYVEVIGFLDVGGIYPGIMTGNTVQLGLTAARAQWQRFGVIGVAVAAFFLGALVAGVIRRLLRRPVLELLLMATLLVVAGWLRLGTDARVPYELPLLAFAMAIQGETIANFGGVSLQTIVVTNNMVKFSDALVGRFLADATGSRSSLAAILLPGLGWLSYSVGAGAGAVAAAGLHLPLLIPAAALIFLVADFLLTRPGASPAARSAAKVAP